MAYGNKSARKIFWTAFASLLGAPFGLIVAQTVETEPKIAAPFKFVFKQNRKRQTGAEKSVERSIAVDSKVNISLCVKDGDVKINGWERGEVRAFVADGSTVDFKVLEKDKRNSVALLKIVGYDTTRKNPLDAEQCLSGASIELDVPRGATVNVKGSARQTTIAAVRRAVVKYVGGDISLNEIEQGVSAATHQGDIIVENSGGAIALESTNGNVTALDVAPGEIGDVFAARTAGGAISLQNVEHRQTEINSHSGAIKFSGAFLSGGQYAFTTQNGTISLAIPEKSSFKVNANYGFGKFDSDLKLNVITVNNASRAQSLNASLGGGDASVNLTTYSGAIRIKKQ